MSKQIMFTLPALMASRIYSNLLTLATFEGDPSALEQSDSGYLAEDINSYSTNCVSVVQNLFKVPPDLHPLTTVDIKINLEDVDIILAGITNCRMSIMNKYLMDVPESILDGAKEPDLSVPQPWHTWYGLYTTLSALMSFVMDAEEALSRSDESEDFGSTTTEE